MVAGFLLEKELKLLVVQLLEFFLRHLSSFGRCILILLALFICSASGFDVAIRRSNDLHVRFEDTPIAN